MTQVFFYIGSKVIKLGRAVGAWSLGRRAPGSTQVRLHLRVMQCDGSFSLLITQAQSALQPGLPHKVVLNWKPVELKMLHFGHCTRTGISKSGKWNGEKPVIKKSDELFLLYFKKGREIWTYICYGNTRSFESKFILKQTNNVAQNFRA